MLNDEASIFMQLSPSPSPAALHAPPLSTDVLVLQNVYERGQEHLLDPAFTPYDGLRNARTEFREMGLFMRLYHSGVHRSANYVGIFSPRFGEKVILPGSDFIKFVKQNPGYDVYFINPVPHDAYFFYNVWSHCDYNHPNLTIISQELFDRANLEFNIFEMGRNSPKTLLYSNYWVGNSKFWDRFMNFTMKLLEALDDMPDDLRRRFFVSDPNYPGPPGAVLSFIFERAFSTYLLMPNDLKALAFPYDREQVLKSCAKHNSGGLSLLRAFKEIIDNIDQRAEYTRQDVNVLRAMTRALVY